MEFAYAQLEPDQIRLLKPLRGVHDYDLRFAVTHVSRDRAPNYTAVSYTWGDDAATELIRFGGKHFSVRPNLWASLFYLSRDARDCPKWDLGWEYIWVDAICINQKDDAERSVQVRAMNKTYSDAVCTSVWLGLATSVNVDLPPSVRSLPPVDDEGFDWLNSAITISNQPYWSRLWVVQEFLLAKNVRLYCSSERTELSSFVYALEFHAEDSLLRPPEHNREAMINGKVCKALPLISQRKFELYPGLDRSLYQLLTSHRHCECKDPRDRVFALLGLLPHDERNALSRFFPDYSLSEDRVIVITLVHLEEGGFAKITPDSEELFMALRVESREHRNRILKSMKNFCYSVDVDEEFSHAMGVQDMVDDMEYQLELEQEQKRISSRSENDAAEETETHTKGFLEMGRDTTIHKELGELRGPSEFAWWLAVSVVVATVAWGVLRKA